MANNIKNHIPTFVEQCILPHTPNIPALYDWQREVLESKKFKDIIADTGRRVGFTTLICWKIVHDLVFSTNKTILVAIPNHQYLKNIRTMLSDIIKATRLPNGSTIQLNHDQLTLVSSYNNVKVFIKPAHVSSVKGHTIDDLYITEADLIPDLREFLLCTIPNLTSRGVLYLNSCVVQRYGYFMQLFLRSAEQDTRFTAIRLPYNVTNNMPLINLDYEIIDTPIYTSSSL
jgi:hypothetical protein